MASRGVYVFTPARQAALAKGRVVSARNRKGRKRVSRGKVYTFDHSKRGQGVAGLKKNATPYARVNKHSQTTGFNAGTVIPGTKKRIVIGGYVRIENTSRHGSIDKALGRAANLVAPRGSSRGKVRSYLRNNVTVTNPAVRANIPGAGSQVRLSTSRGAGPTLTVRRGMHKTPQKKSFAGVKKYDQRMRQVAARKSAHKPRPQHRGK